MSSSSIDKLLKYGPYGNTGNPGNTGNTGNTGNPGNTGNTGSYGKYFVSSFPLGNNIIITFSDGTTAQIDGQFKGSTTADKTLGVVRGSNTGGTDIKGLLFNVSGGTFNFFGICAYGSLRASLTGANSEYISIDSIYYGADVIGNYDPTTLTAREVLYVGNTTTVHGANLKHRSDLGTAGLCGAFDFAYTQYSLGASADTSNHLNSGSKIFTFGPLGRGIDYNGSTFGILLNVENGGVFNLKTPIGIRGITGSFKLNEVISVTLVIDSDNIWNFPSNIYFEKDENYFSCGKNIIGLLSYDAGNTWLAVPSHRGHGIENIGRQCIPGALFGSCCYTNADGTKNCADYTTKETCDTLFGNFYPAQPCAQTCGSPQSVCCANGNCIEGVSVTECEQFGGDYWPNISCSIAGGTLNYPDPTLYTTSEDILAQGRFCYNPCDTKTFCCKDGQCLGEYTRVQCELILGGRSVPGNSCSEIDCCDYSTINGACCKCTQDPLQPEIITAQCLGVLSVTDCKAAGGNYMGPGKQCDDVNCNCTCANVIEEDPLGACCVKQEGTGNWYLVDENGNPIAPDDPFIRAVCYSNLCSTQGADSCICTVGDGSQLLALIQQAESYGFNPAYWFCGSNSLAIKASQFDGTCDCNPTGGIWQTDPPCPGGIGEFGGGGGNLLQSQLLCIDGVKRSECAARSGNFSAYASCAETNCNQTSSCPTCDPPNAWVCAGGECVCRIPQPGDIWDTDCSICTTCAPGLVQQSLINFKIYINSNDYICAPIVCTDCSDMETCD